jgi:hypothetical protein
LAYFIMGRSAGSRNRVLTRTEDGIRTEPFDPSLEMDPSLLIYNAVRAWRTQVIVTNGDHTDSINAALWQGGSFEYALFSRQFEPDAPNFTPRIAGLLRSSGTYTLAILKSADGAGSACDRQLFYYPGVPGQGHCIHTYQGDGNPLPSFQGEPRPVAVWGDCDSFGAEIWNALNPENKIALYVRFADLKSGAVTDKIFNIHTKEGTL